MTKLSGPPIPLLPCPFCGSTDVELDEWAACNDGVKCNICWAWGPITKEFDGGKNAASAWNQRTQPGIDSLVEKLLDLHPHANMTGLQRDAYGIARSEAIAIVREQFSMGVAPLEFSGGKSTCQVAAPASHHIREATKMVKQPVDVESILDAVVGTLSPIADMDWHGKWRIRHALDHVEKLRADMGANNEQ